MKLKNEQRKDCSVLAVQRFVCKIFRVFIFPLSPSYSQGQRCSRCERESETCFLLNGVQCFCRAESDCLVRMLSSMYFLQNTCTFFLTSNQFELQRSLIRINESLPRSSELQARGIWRRSTELLVFRIRSHLVFRVFKSLDAGDVHQNFCLQNLQHLIRTTSLEVGTVHQNFLSQSLQLGFWAKHWSYQRLTIFMIRSTTSEAL